MPIKGSANLFPGAGKPTGNPNKPRSLPAPEPEPEPTAKPGEMAPATDKAELTPVRLYRAQRERLERLRKTLVPGVRLSRSAAVRWIIDHWTS